MNRDETLEMFLTIAKSERETLMRFENVVSEAVTKVIHHMESEDFVGKGFAPFLRDMAVLASLLRYFDQHTRSIAAGYANSVATSFICEEQDLARERGESLSSSDIKSLTDAVQARCDAATTEGTALIQPIRERVIGPRLKLQMELAAKLSGINNQKDDNE